MATATEAASYLRPNGGFTQFGDSYEGITFIEAEPFTKEEFAAAFDLADKAKAQTETLKAQAEADAVVKRNAALAKLEALGLDEDDLKALGLQAQSPKIVKPQSYNREPMAKLCKAGQQLREQIDDDYPDRDRRSDGWIADARHIAKGNSDHIPDARTGIVRALDIDADLGAHKEEAFALVEKLRKLAKRGDKRIKYLIYDGRIASGIMNWRWRKYRGANPHRSHFHISFTTLGDKDDSWFDLEGERNETRPKESRRELAKDIPSDIPSDLSRSRLRCGDDGKCCYCCRIAEHHKLA